MLTRWQHLLVMVNYSTNRLCSLPKVPLTGTALALNCVSVRPCTRLLSTGTRPPLKAGVLVSIEFRLVFPVVCKVAVLAPVGKLTVPPLICNIEITALCYG